MKNQSKKPQSAAYAKATTKSKLLTLLGLIALLGATGAQAQTTDLWSNAPASSNWNNSADWAAGIVPVGGDTLEFTNSTTNTTGGISTLTNDIAAGTSFAGITFDAATNSYTVNGNAITLTGGITNNSIRTEILNFGITNNTAGLVLTNTSTGTVALNGVIAGTGSFVVGGTGTYRLTAANTFSGGVTLNTGTLSISNNASLGAGTLTLNGGTFNNSSSSSANLTVTNNINVPTNANATIDAVVKNMTLSGSILGSGTISRGTTTGLSLFLSGNNSQFQGTFIQQAAAGNNPLVFNSSASGSAQAKWVNNGTGAGNFAVAFGSGTISFGSLTGTGNMLSSVAGTATLSVGALGLNDLYSGNINANGADLIALQKVGTGTMTLSGANTYLGRTTINAGELDITGNSAGTTNTYTVNGGTLGGTGKIGGAVTIASGGFLTPGTNGVAGTLTLTNGLSLAGTTTFNITATNAGSFSTINLSNSVVTYGGALVFNITSATNTWVVGDTYNVFSHIGSTNADFSSVALAGSWSSSFADNNGIWTSGTNATGEFVFNDSTGILSLNAVPEPGTWALFALSGLVLVVVYRRRVS